jgi:hypothetical protein
LPCPAKTTIRNVLTPVYGARQTSRRKKGCISADTEEKYLTLEKETEAYRTLGKSINAKLMSCFNAELHRQAEREVQTLRESNTEEVRIIQEKNSALHRAKRLNDTGKSIQAREIKAIHQRASGTRPAQPLASLKSFKSKSTVINYLQ